MPRGKGLDAGDVVHAGAEKVRIRNRVKELKVVKASELLAHPLNWHAHPASQAHKLRTAVDDIGFIDPIEVCETPKGYLIIDGMLRAGIAEDDEVPIVVTDLTEEEAMKALALQDMIASEGRTDVELYARLLKNMRTESRRLVESVIADTSLSKSLIRYTREEKESASKILHEMSADALQKQRSKTYRTVVECSLEDDTIIQAALDTTGLEPGQILLKACKALLSGEWEIETEEDKNENKRNSRSKKEAPEKRRKG